MRAAVRERGLVVCSVLSGNRNFEGRVHPEVKMNFLASPPLVVAYALAGSMDVDLNTEPLGTGSDGKPVFLKDIWPTQAEVDAAVAAACAELRARLAPERSAYGLLARVNRPDGPLWLLEPMTFMNLSGKSVAALARTGVSFMPQIGQLPGSFLIICGCMPQV